MFAVGATMRVALADVFHPWLCWKKGWAGIWECVQLPGPAAIWEVTLDPNKLKSSWEPCPWPEYDLWCRHIHATNAGTKWIGAVDSNSNVSLQDPFRFVPQPGFRFPYWPHAGPHIDTRARSWQPVCTVPVEVPHPRILLRWCRILCATLIFWCGFRELGILVAMLQRPWTRCITSWFGGGTRRRGFCLQWDW